MNRSALPLAAGLVLLGIVGLISGNYALQWQAVPETWPMHHAGAIVSGLILVALGVALPWRPATRIAGRAVAAIFTVWAAFHLPQVVAAPASSAGWLGVAECLAIGAGGLMMAGLKAAPASSGSQTAARIVFGLCALVFGISHFQFARFTAGMVPGWLPAPLLWAYATGVGHFAAGLAILSGVRARLASQLLTAMMASFVVLLHLPRIATAPSSHLEWTMGAVALCLTGAAFAIWRALSPPVSAR